MINHHNSSNHFAMNNFMPSNFTSALYNQVATNQKTAEYSYDINLSAVNKSLNEYETNSAIKGVAQNIYFGGQ